MENLISSEFGSPLGPRFVKLTGKKFDDIPSDHINRNGLNPHVESVELVPTTQSAEFFSRILKPGNYIHMERTILGEESQAAERRGFEGTVVGVINPYASIEYESCVIYYVHDGKLLKKSPGDQIRTPVPDLSADLDKHMTLEQRDGSSYPFGSPFVDQQEGEELLEWLESAKLKTP